MLIDKENEMETSEDSRYWAIAAHLPEHPIGKWGLVDDEEGIISWFDTGAEAWASASRLNAAMP